MEKRKIIPEFLNIPYNLIIDSRLKPLDIKVFGIILWFRNTSKLKKCFVKNSTIAILLSSKYKKIPHGSVANALTSLEKFKYVKRTFSDKEKKNRLEIIPNDIKKVSSNDDRYHQTMIVVSSNDETGVSSNDEHSNKVKSNKNIDTHTPTFFSEKILLKILKWYFVTISKKATSEKLVSTNKVKKAISGALKEYSPLELLLAIKGFSEDEWQMEKNGFRGAEWFFSDSKRISQYIGLYNKNRQSAFIKEAEKFLKK